MEITVNQLKLHYVQKGKGEDIVLLHGWGIDSTFFNPIINTLGKEFRVTALDIPAHGKSDEPREVWELKNFAEIVVQFIHMLGLKEVTLIGHSNGGRIALYIARYMPENIRRIVITGGAGIRAKPSPKRKRKNFIYQQKKKIYMILKKTFFFKNHDYIDRKMEKLRYKFGSEDYRKLKPEMRGTFINLISEDLSPFLSEIHLPTLLIWGDKDTETPLWMGEKMEQKIIDSGLIIFEGGSHYAYLEQWQRFCTIVTAFVKGDNKHE